MQQVRFHKLQPGDEFTIVGKHSFPPKSELLKIYKVIKWNKPKTWFTKYYRYRFLGD